MTANNTTTSGPVDGAEIQTGGNTYRYHWQGELLFAEAWDHIAEQWHPAHPAEVGWLRLIAERDGAIQRQAEELLEVRRSWAASEEDYMSARAAFRDARQQLADVRRSVEHHANRANTVDALLKDALQGIQTGEVSRARYLIVTARDVIAVGSRQALAASPTAGDAASGSAGEG